MCVDTHRLFCYSTRLVICAGNTMGASRSSLGESKKQSEGRKMIMKAYARVKSLMQGGTNRMARTLVGA
jgi:hypothetical protein